MSTSLISVIIPHYNHSEELQKTLGNIFNQTLKNIEVIIVDDGSDLSHIARFKLEILPKFPRANFIFTEHQGAAAARNRGFKESKGDKVIFWDADITADLVMLEKMCQALQNNPEAAYAYSSFNFGWKKFECGEFDAEKLKKVNYIHTTALIRRENFIKFDESLKKFQDWDLWLSLLERGKKGIWVPEILFTVKPRKTGLSSWLPSFIYHFPWLPIPALKKYNYWKKIVQEKHKI